MTTAQQWQGRLFCVLALLLVLASLAGARLAPPQELLTAAVLVLLLGMPHGSLDVAHARTLIGAGGARHWALFTLAYLGLAAAVVGVWALAPTLFLCAFLAASALHFGGDLAARATLGMRVMRVVYGGAVIVLPAIWHDAELQHLLGAVAGAPSAAFVTPILCQFAGPWMAVTVLACILQARTSPVAAIETMTLAALAVAAPPLVAFTAYFCAMHSPRHVLRTLASLPDADARLALRAAVWPTLAVMGVLAALAAWVGAWTDGVPVEARVMQLMFVGLAALTLPHMLLIEWARCVTVTADR